MRFRHVCEVCGVEKVLTPEDAHDEGWDYPPKMGVFGVVGPRTCGYCPINRTVWWAIVVESCSADLLTPTQQQTMMRIHGEPHSISVT